MPAHVQLDERQNTQQYKPNCQYNVGELLIAHTYSFLVLHKEL